MTNALSAAKGSAGSFTIRRVELDRPWTWLAAGFSDMQRAPGVSLAYGVLFALAGALLTVGLWWAGWIYLALPLAGGFMIIGPLAAVGLYEVSRRLAAGDRPTLGSALGAWRRNAGQIGLMGMALLLLMLAWIRLAVMIFMLFFGMAPPSLEHLVQQTFFSADALPFLIIGTSLGGALALLAFAISAIAIPYLLDHPESDVIQAISVSVAAVGENPSTMIFWGVLIAGFVGAGILTFFVGLVVALPLVGHASWHAYKDLVISKR